MLAVKPQPGCVYVLADAMSIIISCAGPYTRIVFLCTNPTPWLYASCGGGRLFVLLDPDLNISKQWTPWSLASENLVDHDMHCLPQQSTLIELKFNIFVITYAGMFGKGQ